MQYVSTCVHVSLSLARRREKMLDVPDGGRWLMGSKVSSSGKIPNYHPSPGGSHQKADWKKMAGHLNHLSAMVPVSPSLNTIPSLCFKAGAALWFLSAADSTAAAVSFTPAVQKPRGGPNSHRPDVIDAYNTTFMDSRPFQLPSWNPLFCFPALSATSRCPLRDVAIETQHGHKIVECFSIIWH